jgi:hypothetical protein
MVSPDIAHGRRVHLYSFWRGRAVSQKNAEWYRAQAAECLERAEKATDARIKEFNQAEADRWLRLAEMADSQKPS